MKAFTTLCLGIALLLPLPASAQSDATAALEEAHALRKEGKEESALARYAAAIRIDPTLAEAWFFKASVHESLAGPRILMDANDRSDDPARQAAHRAKGIEAYRHFLNMKVEKPAEQIAHAWEGLVVLHATTPGGVNAAVAAAREAGKNDPEGTVALQLLATAYEKGSRIKRCCREHALGPRPQSGGARTSPRTRSPGLSHLSKHPESGKGEPDVVRIKTRPLSQALRGGPPGLTGRPPVTVTGTLGPRNRPVKLPDDLLLPQPNPDIEATLLAVQEDVGVLLSEKDPNDATGIRGGPDRTPRASLLVATSARLIDNH